MRTFGMPSHCAGRPTYYRIGLFEPDIDARQRVSEVVEGLLHNRRLAAIVVADVVGFSRMMEADEVGTLGLLKRRRKNVLEPLVRSHRGRIVKFLGDGVLLEFVSAVAAVECAIQLQKMMAEANGNAPELECVVLRIGINLGDVLGEGSDIYGEGVNVAARLEAIAQPGGICLSEKVYIEVRGKVNAAFVDLGPRKLKNIATPIMTYSVTTDDRPEETVHPGARSDNREFTAVAVLPFTNMSGDQDQDYFVDGITEDLITELSRFKNLSVVARNTTFTFKGRAVDVPEVGRQLGADFVVEGSIRIAANRVRAIVQLVDTGSGGHVFVEKFDRELTDLFLVQDEIVEAIVGRLFFSLQDAAGTMRGKTATTSISAYTSWLRAGAAWRNGDERKAREHMHESVRLDPNYAPALASLSLMYAYWRFSEPNSRTDPGISQECQQYAERAVLADRRDPFVLASVSVCLLLVGKTDQAVRYSELAYSMSPHDMNVLAARGMIVAYAGQHEQGLALIERACRHEPVLPPAYVSSLGDCYYLARKFEEAAAAYRSLIDPPHFFKLNEAACLAHLGKTEEARRRMVEIPKDFDKVLYVRNSTIMCVLPEDRKLWLDGFRQAGVPV